MIEYLVALRLYSPCILISFYDRYALDSRITSIRFDSRFTFTRIYIYIHICVYKCQRWITTERNKGRTISFDFFENFEERERGKYLFRTIERMDNLERACLLVAVTIRGIRNLVSSLSWIEGRIRFAAAKA